MIEGNLPPPLLPQPSRFALYRKQQKTTQTHGGQILLDLQQENRHLQTTLAGMRLQQQQLTTSLEDTRTCLAHSLRQVAELEKTNHLQQKGCSLDQHLVNNLRQLCKELPPTSPLRRPLLCEVTRGLTAAEMMQKLDLTATTSRRVIKERLLPKENSLLWMKARPGGKRRRFTAAREGLREVLNDIAPMPSARAFRVCTSTRRQFYERYVNLTQRKGGHVFARSFFFGRFLRRRHYRHPWRLRQRQRQLWIVRKLDNAGRVVEGGQLKAGALLEQQQKELEKMEEKVWQEMDDEEERGRRRIREEGERIQYRKDASSCHHCQRYEELKAKGIDSNSPSKEQEEYEKKKLHHALIQAQRGTYLLIKVRMEEGRYPPGTILLSQDFTQLVTEKGGFTQDHIMVWFYYDRGRQELVRQTHHFVAGEVNGVKGEKHKADVNLVAAVWELLFESEWKQVNRVIVFSDGCGRQYKLTRYAMYLMRLTQQREGLCIDYHYYPSCHGYGISDVIGAQGQHTINYYEIDTKAAIKTSSELAAVLRRTKNHNANVAPPPLSLSEVASRKGIKSWHHVQYVSGSMTAWRASTDEENGIAPLGRFQEGQQQRSLIYTAKDIEDRRKRKNEPPPTLPHANTSELGDKLKLIQRNKRRKVGL